MSSSAPQGGEQNSTAAITGSIAQPTYTSGTASTNPYGQTMAVYFSGATVTSFVATLDGIAIFATLAAMTTTGSYGITILVPSNSQIKITSAGGSWVWATI